MSPFVRRAVLCAAAALASAAATPGQAPADPPAAGGSTPSEAVPPPAPAAAPKFEAAWNNGLFFQTKDKDYVFHLGGVVHYDAAWYSAPAALQLFPGGLGRFRDGVTPRRLRLFAEGTVTRDYDFLFQLEFANGSGAIPIADDPSPAGVSLAPGPLDVWVTVKDVPLVGNVRVGNQKEWFGLEHLNSARFLEFIERSYLFEAAQLTAFNNARTPGISVFRTWAEDRVFTAVGAYKNVSNVYGFGTGDGEYAVTGRVTGLPVYRPDDQLLWHVGGAMSYRDPVNDQVRVRARPALRSSPSPGPLVNIIADTGFVNADSQTLFNVETAAVAGPVTFQAEYLANLLNGARVGTGPDLGTIRFQGFYAEGMVFLTGESRTWNPKTATFNRVVPRRNFGFDPDGHWADGPGAVELAVRYQYLNLTDGGIAGGRLSSVTLGVNWYWNPNMKVQVNYDYLYRDRAANLLAKGIVHSLGTRLALDF